jgi:DNA (cytosine-5)-methyltransferase 1
MGRQDYETETLIAHALRGEGFDASEDGTGRGTPLVPVAFMANAGSHGGDVYENLSPTLRVQRLGGSGMPETTTATAVRRLTPRECERLQGFPDDYTLVPHRGKPMADGPRYKALGNSMAVPVMRWIGERIAMVEAIKQERKAA